MMKTGLRKMLFILCVLGAGICIGFLAHYYMKLHKNEQIYEELQNTRQTENPETSGETEISEKALQIPIDFEALRQVNPEIYAWIEIPGTEVNYPIVQSATDNGYYLNHTIEGVAGYPGAIYTEGVNSKDFSDFNTLIYGHDMEDGSMFGGLYRFEDEEYLKAHETLVIYTPEHRYTYRIFKALTYDDRHILGFFDFSDKKQREEFLTSISNTDSAVTADSHLLTLSTCIADQPEHRLLVEAVFVDEE